MAVPTDTVIASSLKQKRESLADAIYRVSPEDTPFLAAIGKESVNATYHEWIADDLGSADTANKLLDGADAVNTTIAAKKRYANYCQISGKVVQVSGRSETVAKAGPKSVMAYEISKYGLKLRKDVEAIVTSTQAAAAESAPNAATTAGIGSWVTGTNASRGAGAGADPVLSGTTDGYPTTAAVDGTQRAFTEALLAAVIQAVFTKAGKAPRMCFLGPVNKAKASAFAGLATQRRETGNKAITIIAAADTYISNYGDVQFIPCLQQRERTAILINPEYVTLGILRDFRTDDLAKLGDSIRKQILVDYCLWVKQPDAHGVVADLTTT